MEMITIAYMGEGADYQSRNFVYVLYGSVIFVDFVAIAAALVLAVLCTVPGVSTFVFGSNRSSCHR